MAKENKFAKVEGLLYAYKTLPCVIKGLELKYRETGYDTVKEELEAKKLTYDIANNMIEFLKLYDEEAYQVIKLKYIDKCTWLQVALQMNMGERTVQRIRDNIIKKQLIAFV